ncbi:Putative epidermal cell surface receptor [Gryllus bimaculatus]|nr:Putative epidermal cell surface receptor [Gryllus bimaculatus]
MQQRKEEEEEEATMHARPPAHATRSNPSICFADYAVTSVPGGFAHLPVSGQPEEVSVQTLEALDATSVRVVFAVPPVFVGLHGRIELRYTDDKTNDDLSSWKLQVLAPPQDLLATPTLEFTLGDLRPDTEYRVKITVLLRDLQNTPSSPVLVVRTQPLATSTLPPVVAVSPDLSTGEVNTTWAVITWRRFSESELQLIDGVQLRYKQLDDKVYSATPLIHRAVTSYTLENLQPSTTYEVGIFFIPFPGQTSELQADAPIQITTKEAQDLYKFEVHVEVHHIKVTSVEVNWTGVPYPEDKYVNIYRAIYQSDSGKEDFSTFTVAKRDSTSSTLIKDLAPGTRYRLWLEVYLTNGKIKKSNVQDFSTRPGSVASVGSSHQGKLESAASPVKEAADYYSPLVAVAILAALAIMATLILLLMLMKRRGQTKAAISAGRKSQSAYDNPSYKTCEEQQPAANGNGSAAKAPPTPASASAPAPAPAPEPA